MTTALDRVGLQWRGAFTSAEVEALHAAAFEHPVGDHDWAQQLERLSLGWVTARDDDGGLIGFVNVAWDGRSHAFILDTAVATRARRRGVGLRLIQVAREQAAAAGCDWLHVDFEDHLRAFYLESCGFAATDAGVMPLALKDSDDVSKGAERGGRVTIWPSEPISPLNDLWNHVVVTSGAVPLSGHRLPPEKDFSRNVAGLRELLAHAGGLESAAARSPGRSASMRRISGSPSRRALPRLCDVPAAESRGPPRDASRIRGVDWSRRPGIRVHCGHRLGARGLSRVQAAGVNRRGGGSMPAQA